jgi:hypothetical protein
VDDDPGLEALRVRQEIWEFLQDPTRSLRRTLAGVVVGLSTLASIVAVLNAVVTVRHSVGSVPVRFLALQCLATIPFTLAVILAVISLRAPRLRALRHEPGSAPPDPWWE